MGIKLESSRLMVRHAAKMISEKTENYTMYCAMAKKYGTDNCIDVVNEAL
jgi:alkylation response protein AidB-like acyl-CoA dehydrogenase